MPFTAHEADEVERKGFDIFQGGEEGEDVGGADAGVGEVEFWFRAGGVVWGCGLVGRGGGGGEVVGCGCLGGREMGG